MENVIDLLDKEKMVEFGYVGEYEPCHTAYVLEDLTFCECQALASEVDFEIRQVASENDENEVMYKIVDCQGGWKWIEYFRLETPQLALDGIENVLLDIGIALIPKAQLKSLKLDTGIEKEGLETAIFMLKNNKELYSAKTEGLSEMLAIFNHSKENNQRNAWTIHSAGEKIDQAATKLVKLMREYGYIAGDVDFGASFYDFMVDNDIFLLHTAEDNQFYIIE